MVATPAIRYLWAFLREELSRGMDAEHDCLQVVNLRSTCLLNAQNVERTTLECSIEPALFLKQRDTFRKQPKSPFPAHHDIMLFCRC